ncbi:MAG: glutamine--fructose-6-phosphate transaminase (isomerizing) [Acidimicrobiia bacterium]|nr:glutamine--fructose-6-phosphate transaminase (isomerizing) [Acidimicrobiia bacterium]MDH5615800.1 glutamine--fructose-6-phosphate transaminase (isomerizing) [Acidimicrobiia bacterium]
MCGIVGYVGPRQAQEVLISSLRRLEYRGYDSAGIAITDNGRIEVRKSAGKLQRLDDLLEARPVAGTTGIGHTRWATHGVPNDVNAHPHVDASGEFVLVHNGIIENFLPLKEELLEEGHEFQSDTDTEVLVHLVADEYEGDLIEAVRRAIGRARGAYALVVMTSREPGRIVAARMVSPLVVGFGDGETFLASDIPAILPYTRSVLVVSDGEMVDITADGATVQTIGGEIVDRAPMEVTWDAGRAEKDGYPHFMLKEIYEQPGVIEETLRGRLQPDGSVVLEGVDLPDGFAAGLEKIWITACGTAYHAGLVGRDVLEKTLRIPVEIDYAHELRYRDPLIRPGTLTIAISQSGETADTLAAGRLASRLGSRLLALTNVVGSTLSRDATDVLYTRAGPEIAVASTKAYTAMLIGAYLLALQFGLERRTVGSPRAAELAGELRALPEKATRALGMDADIAKIAGRIVGVDDIYFIGRGLDYAVATEGSLKLKEISYMHSEAMPAGELKHGTLALITEGTPVVVVLTQSHLYDKTISGLQEVKARGAKVVAVAYEDDAEVAKYADHVLRIPRTADFLSPVLSIIPLQLLAYHVAKELGHDIDMPRNLAKSVTVE